MNEIIREIQKTDRKRVLEIINECLIVVNSKNYSSKFIKSLRKSYSKHFMKRPELYIFVIVKHDIILGTGSISSAGQIRDVFIDVKEQRKGWGKKLVKYLEDIAKNKNIEKLFLYSAISAVGFYEKLGYIEVDTLKHGNKDMEIRLEKNCNN